MPSPIGHTLVGISIYLAWSSRYKLDLPIQPQYSIPRNTWVLFVVLANLPDIDFLIGWLITGDPNRYHYGLTHTLAFAVIVAVGIAFFWRIDPAPLKRALILFSVIGSHIGLDFFTGPRLGMRPAYGFPWLSPIFTETHQAPFSLFVGTKHQNLDQILSLHNWIWAGYEALVLGPVVLILVIKRRWK